MCDTFPSNHDMNEFTTSEPLNVSQFINKTVSGVWRSTINETLVIPPKPGWEHLQTGGMLEECLLHSKFGNSGTWTRNGDELSLSFDLPSDKPWNKRKDKILILRPDDPPISVTADSQIVKDGRIVIAIAFVHELRKLLLNGWLTKHGQEKRVFSGQIKGKMLLQDTLRQGILRGRGDRAVCQVSVRTPDHPVNRVFRYALQLCRKILLRSPTGNSSLARTWVHLRYCEDLLSGVPIPKHLVNTDFQLKGLTGFFHRHGQVLNLAKAITHSMPNLGGKGGGNVKVIPFLAYRPILFEWWLACRIKNSCPEGWELFWNDKPKGWPYQRNDHLPGLLPDFILRNKESNMVRILDAKYKKYWELGIEGKCQEPNDYQERRKDYHQVGAYGYAFGADRVGLIFPVSDKGTVFSPSSYDKNVPSSRSFYLIPISRNSMANFLKDFFKS